MAVTADSPMDKAGLVLGPHPCASPTSVRPVTTLGGDAKPYGEPSFMETKEMPASLLSGPSSLISWSLLLSFSGHCSF